MRLHTTYIQRHNTNTYVYKKTNEELNAATEGPDRRIKPLTEVLELRKFKLLGHWATFPDETDNTFNIKSLLPLHQHYRKLKS